MGYYSTGKNIDYSTTEIKKVEKMEEKKFERNKTLNIYQRMNLVQDKVDYLQKDKSVPTSKTSSYNALTHDKVVGVIREYFVAYGIATLPSIVSTSLERTVGHTEYNGQKQEKINYFTQVHVRLRFVNIDDPKDYCEAEGIGYGTDPQDKGAGKALSYSVKYIILKTFMIESGDDEENREPIYTPDFPKNDHQNDALRYSRVKIAPSKTDTKGTVVGHPNDGQYRYPWGANVGKTIDEIGGVAEAEKYYAALMKRKDANANHPDMKAMMLAIVEARKNTITTDDIPY